MLQILQIAYFNPIKISPIRDQIWVLRMAHLHDCFLFSFTGLAPWIWISCSAKFANCSNSITLPTRIIQPYLWLLYRLCNCYFFNWSNFSLCRLYERSLQSFSLAAISLVCVPINGFNPFITIFRLVAMRSPQALILLLKDRLKIVFPDSGSFTNVTK